MAFFTHLTRPYRDAGIDLLTCPILDCPFHDIELSRKSWSNHMRMSHLAPEPERTCAHDGCSTSGRGIGMWKHETSHDVAPGLVSDLP